MLAYGKLCPEIINFLVFLPRKSKILPKIKTCWISLKIYPKTQKFAQSPSPASVKEPFKNRWYESFNWPVLPAVTSLPCTRTHRTTRPWGYSERSTNINCFGESIHVQSSASIVGHNRAFPIFWCNGYDSWLRISRLGVQIYRNFCFWKEKPSVIRLFLNS